MTTIVACAASGLMVADSRVTDVDAGIKWPAKKIERINESLYGFAGDSEDIEKMISWFRRSRAGTKPKVKEFKAIVLSPEGLLLWDQTTKNGVAAERSFHAIGSGAAAALGAMLNGCNPVRAVEIACLIDSESEGPVQVVHLKEGARGSA